MKKTCIAIVALIASVGLAVPAHAGSGSAGGSSVTWDDSKMYLPGEYDCNKLLFNYTNDDSVTYSSLDLLNAYGTRLGGGTLRGPSGQESVQVCGGEDFTAPLVVRLQSNPTFGSGGSTQIVDLPFSFNKQSQFVRCIKKSNFKQKRYTGKWAERDKCPKGWVKITI